MKKHPFYVDDKMIFFSPHNSTVFTLALLVLTRSLETTVFMNRGPPQGPPFTPITIPD